MTRPRCPFCLVRHRRTPRRCALKLSKLLGDTFRLKDHPRLKAWLAAHGKESE